MVNPLRPMQRGRTEHAVIMNRSPAFPLFRLPDDLLGVIFSFLPISDLAQCSRVSKRFYRSANANNVWRTKIKQYHLLRTDANAMEDSNWEDLKKHLSFPRWVDYRRWCSPEALQISESELRDVHEQFVRAVRDLAVTALAFRGKRYPIVRVEQAPQFHWWWAEPRAALKVLTETFKLSFHAPVKPPNAPPAYVSVDNDLAVDRPATKTIVRRRDILHNGGSASPALNRRHQKRCDTRAPAAAIVDGVVLRVPASALGVTPVEEAGREVGHAKFVFRHAYLKFYDLCPLCARNRSADCNGDIPPFCRPCWLSHDLNLYMSAAQAWLEYGMAPADLADAHTRYVDGARIGNKLYHKRGCITAHSASATPSAESSPAPSPDECASGPLAPDTPFYREFDVAYLAILKYGSSAAIARRRDERAAAAAVALVADEAMLDVEALEQRREKGRKRRAATEEELDGNYVAGGRQAKVARRPKKAARRTPRKAARGKFYGEERDALDTRVDESTLGDILRWGVSVA